MHGRGDHADVAERGQRDRREDQGPGDGCGAAPAERRAQDEAQQQDVQDREDEDVDDVRPRLGTPREHLRRVDDEHPQAGERRDRDHQRVQRRVAVHATVAVPSAEDEPDDQEAVRREVDELRGAFPGRVEDHVPGHQEREPEREEPPRPLRRRTVERDPREHGERGDDAEADVDRRAEAGLLTVDRVDRRGDERQREQGDPPPPADRVPRPGSLGRGDRHEQILPDAGGRGLRGAGLPPSGSAGRGTARRARAREIASADRRPSMRALAVGVERRVGRPAAHVLPRRARPRGRRPR